ncbi:hypothetical protein [Helicobacter himalayensis]|nr:hypothetical protein [Helicobacter himalayensis]
MIKKGSMIKGSQNLKVSQYDKGLDTTNPYLVILSLPFCHYPPCHSER